MWVRFFWVHQIREKKVWKKKRKKKLENFCVATTQHSITKDSSFCPLTIQAFGCCCWLWVVVFVVWEFWQFVLVCGLCCMCNLRFPKGSFFNFFFPSHKAKSSWEEVEEEEEEEED
jgi:hypothetical protein